MLKHLALVVVIGAVIGAFYFFTQIDTTLNFKNTNPSVTGLRGQDNKVLEEASGSEEIDPNWMLPDLIPFPPQDLRLSHGGTRIHFSTTYYNAGEGALELTAVPGATPTHEDVERDVSQTIFLRDGGSTSTPSGTFFWHEPHQHYHFEDFVDYKVESIENFNYRADGGRSLTPSPADIGNTEKATFCVRDISRVDGIENTADDAAYKICSRWRQGVSVGWGDTYFHDYPDQFLDITNFPSGQYKLSFDVNPRTRFLESNYSNNYSYVVFVFDAEKPSFEIIESFPVNVPEIEHVYPEQLFF